MKSDPKEEADRRLGYVRFAVAVLAVVLLIQLFDQSVVNNSSAKKLADSQHIIKQSIEPRRGNIYAQTVDGLYPLATTDEKFSISVVPKNVKDKNETAKTLSEDLNIPKDQIFELINNDKPYIPPLKKRIDAVIARKIADRKMVGVLVIPEFVRYYPENDLASQVLGFVNYENQGSYGLEGYYSEPLRGLSGSVIAEKDNKGRFINILSKQSSSKDGDSLVLTIDQNVQFVVEQALKEAIEKFGAKSGQVVIENVKNGAIIAMASSPSFNPNKFNEVKKEDQNVFFNPVIGSVYEPGSIFKPIIVSIGLETQKFTPDFEGTYSNMTVVQGYEIHTAQDKSFGKENITQILENSDNVAMVSLADKIGNDTLHEYLEKFGIGSKVGIDSDGETTGYLPPLKLWRDIHRATISFGQGISVTPLQILMGYQTIGNDGKLVQPRLVEKIITSTGEQRNLDSKDLRQVISPQVASDVRRMLISVVERGHGKKAAVEGYKIGGKTGTAQVPKTDGPGYEEDTHIGSFAGLVPGDNPQFAMLVKLDKPSNVEFAESSAAPTFGKIAKFLTTYYQIPKE